MHVKLRRTIRSDSGAIAEVVRAAFGAIEGPEIVRLIADLADDPSAQPVLSLVATVEGRVVGHILFSTVQVLGSPVEVSGAILAPLAVHPDFQSRGIGGQLINEGLRRLSETGTDLVFVLGHPGYYPKLGFAEAGSLGFETPYPIAERNAAAWMVRELRPGTMQRASGRVRCADSLNDPNLWQE